MCNVFKVYYEQQIKRELKGIQMEMVVYYEEAKGELKRILIYECWCNEKQKLI